MSKLAWGLKVSEEFRTRVFGICSKLGWQPEQGSDLMSCMAWEAAETFSPSIKNAAGSGATGLIQFMPSTARGLNTTVELLARMTAVQQLDYVERYFTPYYSRIHTLSDMYMAILMPKYVGKPEDSVLFTDGTIAYRQNGGLDSNNDRKITKAEAAGKVAQKLQKGLLPAYCWEG